VIHKLAKENSPITTLPILFDSLVHRLYKGCHIWRKVKNRNISRPKFKFTRVYGAVIKKRPEFAVFRQASLAEIFFRRGTAHVEKPTLKDLPVSAGI